MSIQGICAYSSGAPKSTCHSMAPNIRSHNAVPRNDPPNPQNTMDNTTFVEQYVDWDSGFEGPAALNLDFFDR